MFKSVGFLIIIFLAWLAVGVDWYVCQIKKECRPSVAKVYDSIYFSKSSDKAYYTDTSYLNFTELKMEMAQATGDSFLVEVRQFSDESPALLDRRTDIFKNLLSKHFDLSRFKFQVFETPRDAPENTLFKVFNITRLLPVVEQEVVPDSNDFKIENNTIFFPQNSTSLLNSLSVNVYVDESAAKAINGNVSISIHGHTDSSGREQYNYRLALKRANQLRDMFLTRGVSADKIFVKSFGERVPMESNETLAGRQKNRRVEIKFNEDK